MSSKAQETSNNVVDLQAYARARASIGSLLGSMKLYQEQLNAGRGVAYCRENVLGILLPYCQHPEVVEALELTNEQLSEMKAGGEIPRHAVDKFIQRLEEIYANIGSYID